MKKKLIHFLIWLVDKISPVDNTRWRISHESYKKDLAGVIGNQTRKDVLHFLLTDDKDPERIFWEIESYINQYNEKG